MFCKSVSISLSKKGEVLSKMDEVWDGSSMLGFCDARRRLPINHQSLTQLGRGHFEAHAKIVSGSDAMTYLATVGTLSNTMIELDSNYTGIVVPIRWRGDLVINGAQAQQTNIYLPQDKTPFQARGEERATIGICMLREQFVATVAALEGVAPDDLQLDEGCLELPTAVMTRGRRLLSTLFDQCIDSDNQKQQLVRYSPEQFTRRITQIAISLYLHARPEKPASRSAAKLTAIVQAAEERFAAAQAEPVSLADLCAAAGVSHVTLCHAFMVVCNSSPMAYFKKRRLTEARIVLLRSKPEIELVKRAARGAGLTHMGRFSAEYQQLFGELPKATLNRTQH